MNLEELKSIFELGRQRDEKMYAWLRNLVLLASGALTVIVSLGAGANASGVSLQFLRLAWLSLGSGILLGAVALHGEVWTAAELARQMNRQIKLRPPGSTAPLGPIFAPLPARYKWSRILCYAALTTAVISLVAHSVLRS